MKRGFWKLVLIVFVGLVAVGFARGWLVMSKSPESPDHKIQVELTVDPDKAKEDAKTVEDKAKQLSHDAAERVHDAAQRTEKQHE